MTVRPQYQRAFLAWLERSRSRLKLQPQIWFRSDLIILLKFDDLSSEVTIELTHYGLSDGGTAYRLEVWGDTDCLSNAMFFTGADVFRTSAGYLSNSRDSIAPPVWPSRAAIWQNLVFEPFLEWVNETLAQAVSIAHGHRPLTVDHVTNPDGSEKDSRIWVPSVTLIRAKTEIEPSEFRSERLVPLRQPGSVTRRRR